MVKDIEKKSRDVFGSHHIVEQSNGGLYDRKFERINYRYLKLPEGWFKGKKVLDACSGTSLTNTHKLLEYGAEVTSLDLKGKDDFNESRISEFKGKYTLITGNVLDIPFENLSFDYVHCEGALHHTRNPRKGFMELARVCNSYLYISVFGTAGIFRIAEDALREEYKTNKNGLNLKEFVDNLDENKLKEIIRFLNDNRKGEDKYFSAFPEEWFDEDLVVSIKDRLQPPIYTRHSAKEVRKWYKEEGFKECRRLTRYPIGCRNIRRYMNPVYEQYYHPISKLLNGEGFMQFIGTK